MSAGCSGCPLRWSSLSAAHCTLCHETFTTVGNFDRHRNGPARKGDRSARERRCWQPELVGLEPDHRGFWRMPAAADVDWTARAGVSS